MKSIIFGLFAGFMFMASNASFADVFVNGYYKSNGTYVQPHYRSDPNSTRLDNWSTRGNINPYTGKRGYMNPNAPLYDYR